MSEKTVLLGRKTNGAEDSPEARRVQLLLLNGDPRDAAAEWMKMGKELLLNAGMILPCLYFDTPAGPVMMPIMERQDLRQITRRAANLSIELNATRVLGFGTHWLVDKALVRGPDSRRKRKQIMRTREPGLLAFCADAKSGVAIRIVRIHRLADGKPVGFSDPDPNHDIGGLATIVTTATASGFIADPARRAAVSAGIAKAWELGTWKDLPSPAAIQADAMLGSALIKAVQADQARLAAE